MSEEMPGAEQWRSGPTGEVSAAVSNASMAARILTMPVQPYQDGGYVLRVARIPGRRTGQVHQVPLAVVTAGGQNFLISPRVSRQWARNLVLHPACEIVSAAGSIKYLARPATPAQALSVLRLYLGQLGWAAAQFPFTVDDSDATILARLDQAAVFRLDHDQLVGAGQADGHEPRGA